MNISFNSFSNSTISSFKGNVRPGLDYKRIIIGIALVALSFMVVTIYSNCCTKVKKTPLKNGSNSDVKDLHLKSKILPDDEIWDKIDDTSDSADLNKGVKYSSDDPEVLQVASQIVEDVFDVYTNPSRDPKAPSAKLKDFSFKIFHPQAAGAAETPPLLVKFKSGAKESTIPLYTILKAIQWNKLDSKWGNLTGEQWNVASKRSLFDKGYKEKHHYLKAYTGVIAYKTMNLFLRQAKVNQDFNVGSWNNEMINRVAKEGLFACLSATGSLKEFQSVAPHVKVYRNVQSKDALYLLNKYEVGKIVTEESFLSTAQGGTTFTGDIEYHIKLAPKSRGRSIESISKYPSEKECLFLPFTSFKVDNFYFVKKSTGAAVKTEAFENGSENILNTDIRKIIELSEVPTA